MPAFVADAVAFTEVWDTLDQFRQSPFLPLQLVRAAVGFTRNLLVLQSPTSGAPVAAAAVTWSDRERVLVKSVSVCSSELSGAAVTRRWIPPQFYLTLHQ